MLKRTCVWSAALLLLSGVAGAVEPPEPPEPFGGDGWYVGVQGVYAIEYFDGVPADNQLGFNAHAGYRFLKNFAIDLEGEYIPGFDVGRPGFSGTFDTWNVALNFKVYPLARAQVFEDNSPLLRFQPFIQGAPAWQWGRLRGLGALNASDGSFMGRAGGGADFYITKKLALTANAVYNFTTNKLSGSDYVSIGWGFQYHFGVPEY